MLLHEICEFMQYRAYFWELVRVSYLTFYYFPKIAREHTVLFLISTLNDGSAIRCLLLHQHPQFMQPLNLMRVSYFFLHWESLAIVRYSLPLLKGDLLNFSSHLKCHQPATH